MTLIVVSHDIPSVEGVDKIFVLHQGELAHEGSHLELLAQHAKLYLKLLGMVDEGQEEESERRLSRAGEEAEAEEETETETEEEAESKQTQNQKRQPQPPALSLSLSDFSSQWPLTTPFGRIKNIQNICTHGMVGGGGYGALGGTFFCC